MTDFWKPLESTPEDETTYFTIMVDELDQLFAGTDRGLFITNDQGKTWSSLLSSDIPIVLLAQRQNKLFAIAADKTIYASPDMGTTWESSYFDQETEITDLLVLSDGTLLMSTGHFEEKNEAGVFRGKGLFKSIDDGKSWQKVNLAMNPDHYIAHLVQDSKGRIYASLNEYNTKDGAILYSQDQGKSWNKLPPLSFDWGANDIGTTSIVYVTSMAIDRNDNLVLGLSGTSGTVATSVNLKNSFQGAVNGTEWHHVRIVPFGYDWFYLEAHQLFFPSNGSAFASRIGQSYNLSGIFHHSGHRDATFEKQQVAPIFMGDIPNFTQTTFAETSNNRVFVVQELDRTVYYTDLEKIPLGNGQGEFLKPKIFPNPFHDLLKVEMLQESRLIELAIYDMKGSLVYKANATDTGLVEIRPDIQPGLYILHATIDGKVLVDWVVRR